MPRLYRCAGEEPTLEEVFADPIVHAVMRRDRVTRETLCSVVQTARQRLGLVPSGVVLLPCAQPPASRCPDDARRMRCG
jgi:hypothetical protein